MPTVNPLLARLKKLDKREPEKFYIKELDEEVLIMPPSSLTTIKFLTMWQDNNPMKGPELIKDMVYSRNDKPLFNSLEDIASVPTQIIMDLVIKCQDIVWAEKLRDIESKKKQLETIPISDLSSNLQSTTDATFAVS
jgi:hypothetical protein